MKNRDGAKFYILIAEMPSLLSQIQDSPGFALGFGFTSEELTRLRAMIAGRWLERIRAVHPELAPRFEALGIERYHELSDKLDHASLWKKDFRLFSPEEVKELRGMSLFDALTREFGPVEVAQIEGIGYPEIYWRLVRPGKPDDVAGVHADSWFYTFTHDLPRAEQAKLLKVWAAVFVKPAESGLRVVPDSHKKEWPRHSEVRHGRAKPVLDVDESKLDLTAVRTRPGEAIVFNNWLLHGGIPHRCDQTRVSIEFAVRLKSIC
jgi:hypothetical protein